MRDRIIFCEPLELYPSIDWLPDPCRKYPNGRLYSDAQTCHGYFRCLNRRSVWGTCPDGFALNAIKQRCAPDRTCRQALGSLHRKYTPVITQLAFCINLERAVIGPSATQASILTKSIAGRYRPVRVADESITARYRFIKNASWAEVKI